MAEWVQLIEGWITAFLKNTGLWGIFLALAIESACIPITSEAFLLFGGFLIAQGQFNLWSVVLAGVAGFTAGALLPYYLGDKHGESILGVGGRWLLASGAELDKVTHWFETYGQRAVFFGRMIPLVRDFISIPAGLARMPLGRFVAYTAAGCFPWVFGVTAAGRLLEGQWPAILAWIERGNRMILATLLSLVVLLVVRRLWLRSRSSVR